MKRFIPKKGVYFPKYISMCRSHPFAEKEDPELAKIYNDIYELIHKFAEYCFVKYKRPKNISYVEILYGILSGWPSCSAIAYKGFLDLMGISLKKGYRKAIIKLLCKKN